MRYGNVVKENCYFMGCFSGALYALNSPVSKLLLDKISPTMMAAFLYLGAGIGLAIVRICTAWNGERPKGETINP